MKFSFNIFLLSLVVDISFTEDIKDLSVPQLIKLAQDVTKLNSEKVQDSDVTFYLTSRSLETPIKLDDSNMDLLNVSLPTKFVIHGWLEDYRASWYQKIANEFFKIMDINLIEVDWKRPARFNYVLSAGSTKIIGHLIANFILDLNLDPKTIHLIGHSLGSHIAGFCAKETLQRSGNTIRRISALDPAGPYFRTYFANSNQRLDRHDADIVDIIHTDAGVNGYELPIGTIDFYINRGKRVQPGCLEHNDEGKTVGGAVQSTFCSHTRSYTYFIEWINDGKFECRFCTPLTSWLGENCLLQTTIVPLGEEDINDYVTGVCYAVTNLHPPFLANSN